MGIMQVIWAKQHDWYIGHDSHAPGKYAVIVRDDMDADNTLIFDNFQDLREWAGY